MGDTWEDESGRVDVWTGKKKENGELEERSGEIGCGWKLVPRWEACAAATLRAKNAAETNTDGEERVGTREREMQEGI